jgi:hypothetical protein
LSAALPVATKALPSLARLARQSPSCCHSFFFALSATGGAQKRPQLRHTPKYENQFARLLKAHNIFIIYEKKVFVKNKIFFVGKIFQKI